MADNPAHLFLVTDYRTLMGAFVERKQMLGLTNLELDELGGFAGGYTSKLFCGSKRLGLETLGKMLIALKIRILVVPEECAEPGSKTIRCIPFKDLSEELKNNLRRWGKDGGRKSSLMNGPRKRRAIAAMGGRAAAEARRLRKLGLEPVVKKADPATMRKLERRPIEKRPVKPKEP